MALSTYVDRSHDGAFVVTIPAHRLHPPHHLGLTPAEHETAILAAAGFTNRQIAEWRHTSPRTVGNLLQHVYDKLGVHSRGELAEALSRSV